MGPFGQCVELFVGDASGVEQGTQAFRRAAQRRIGQSVDEIIVFRMAGEVSEGQNGQRCD